MKVRLNTMVMRKMFISIMVMGILLMSGSVTTSRTLTPLWHFQIEDMTGFAMSEKGEYIIVACEKGPLCEKGQYYVFDRFGDTVDHGCVEGEITVVDIADDGTFFIGTRTGYYFSPSSGGIHEDLDMGIIFQSVSISANGEHVVAGTDREVFIFDKNGIKTSKEIGQPILNTTISASGNIAVAGTRDNIFLYEESTDSWKDYSTVSKPVGLAISDDERIVVCGMHTGFIYILDSQLRLQKKISSSIPGGLNCMAMTGDGKYLACGSTANVILYIDSSGNEIWSSDSKGTIKDIAISSDGDIVAVLSDNITFFNFNGDRIQELKPSGLIQYMQLSKFGEVLSYSSDDELMFFNLYQQSHTDLAKFMDISEYPLSSRRSIPLDDQLIEVWSYGSAPRDVVTADVNGDGYNEIICTFSNELAVLNSEKKVLWEKQFMFNPGISVMDVTGDLVPEILVKSDNNRMEIQIFDGNGRNIANHEFYYLWYGVPPPKESGNIGIFPLWSGNIDSDDSIEVICKVHAGYILRPRGLYAFEYPSFKEEWYYPVGPHLAAISIVDIDGDGEAEIIAGSEAPGNGNREGDTDDFHAYVFAVTLQGKAIWKEEIGPEGFNRVYVAPVDLYGDGNLEIVGGGWSFNDDWGTLFVMNAEGKYIQGGEDEFNHSLFLNAIADMDNDGDLEIIATTTSELVLYNDKLREIISRNLSMTFGKFTHVTTNDIDADDEKEIILTSEDPKLLILNTDLEEEWNKTFPGYTDYLRAAVVNLNKCKNHLLVLSDKLYAYTYSNNSRWPYVPWVITKEEKIKEIDDSLEEAQKYLRLGDLDKAKEYLSQAEEAYEGLEGEEGLEESYTEIQNVAISIELYTPETPEPTSPPPETPPPTTSPPMTPSSVSPTAISKDILAIALAVISILLAFFEIRYETIRRWLGKGGLQSLGIPEKAEMEPTIFKNDIAISFAEEDRKIARELAKKLRKKKIWGRKVRVFFDEFYKSELWGKKLTKYFQGIYGPKTRFVVLLLSKYYPVKNWTGFEFSIMRAEAEKRETEFILLVRLDDTKMEGIEEDRAYLDYRKEGIDGIVDCLMKKLSEPIDLKLQEESKNREASSEVL